MRSTKWRLIYYLWAIGGFAVCALFFWQEMNGVFRGFPTIAKQWYLLNSLPFVGVVVAGGKERVEAAGTGGGSLTLAASVFYLVLLVYPSFSSIGPTEAVLSRWSDYLWLLQFVLGFLIGRELATSQPFRQVAPSTGER